MKKINVYVKDRNTIVLDEDAVKGDYIDLSSLANVDFSAIELLIEEGKDKVYENKLNELKKILDTESKNQLLKLDTNYKIQIEALNNQLKELKSDKENALKQRELELTNTFNGEINKLKNQLDSYNDIKKNEILEIENKLKAEINNLNNQLSTLRLENKNDINTLKNKYESELLLQKSELEKQANEIISNLKNTISNYDITKKMEIDNLKNENQVAIINKEKEYEKILANIKEDHQKEISAKDLIIREKEDAFNTLQRQRASLNVKQTGEDLESWCDHELQSHMQNGLFNCTWDKDNKVIKEDGEVKGSKADYIFKVYASKEHNENELLAAVCLDMKDENPDSVNKKKNSDYYFALDKNRQKKNCKYAVLVSNLETDKTGDLPIFKVLEYPDMYVVRPAYMMTFLNMITSLTTRFADLVLADEDRKLEIKKSIDFKEEFDRLKNTYLDKPLEKLTKDLSEIKKNNDNIINAAKRIEDSYDSIMRNYINVIMDKINNFDLKISREYKKFEKD